MIRYACTVCYVGRNYDGWQTQRNGNSIQEKLEEVLSRICDAPIRITGSGRTDAGVSARGQVFHFDTERDMTEYKWYGAINAFLPDDIHVMSIVKVPRTFHARYSVRWKNYKYRINVGKYDVFQKDNCYQLCRPLDLEKMREGSQYLLGTHDFTSYNASSLEQYPDQRRPIYDITITQEGDIVTLSYTGKGFLRYMVRMMSGTLIEVGLGKYKPVQVKEILDQKDKRACHKNAPANGLTLNEVKYFQTAVLEDTVMVREYLEYDQLPENLSMSQIETEQGKYWAYVERNAQNILADITVDEKGIHFVYRKGNVPSEMDLEVQNKMKKYIEERV